MEIDADALYDEVYKLWGAESQINMAVEECGELIVALQQFKRGRVEPGAVAEEIADVQIMCEQLRVLFSEEHEAIRRRKLRRLRERVDDAKARIGGPAT